MKERPILFSAPMVRAILSGQKTMTRRVLKNQPVMLPDFNRGGLSICVGGAKYQAFCPVITAMNSPYGKTGDRLWVRETWTHNSVMPLSDRVPGEYIYRADLNDSGASKWAATWKPSIFMPRAASRVTLEITGVKVERLQDISEDDAKAEGVDPDVWCFMGGPEIPSYVSRFKDLWDSINGKTPGKSWDDNPFVWAISFKRVTT